MFDRALNQRAPAFKKWSSQFKARIALEGSEKTKSLEKFPSVVNQLLEQTQNFSSREMTLLVVGGGTLTDLGGFLASVFKRGIRLILMPTTWLSAMDSAHGGKNGLNFSDYKNQIGTFYFPERIEIVKPILFLQPRERAEDAFGELVKIAFISASPLFRKIQKFQNTGHEEIYSSLPLAIAAKNKIVREDPFEKKKKRQILNLGHTFAHAMEKIFQISHGEAVLYGVVFSLIWSRSESLISSNHFEKLIQLPLWPLCFHSEIYFQLLQASPKQVEKCIQQDKKKTAQNTLLEPFIAGQGKVILKEIKARDFMNEFLRQKKVIQRARDEKSS